MFTSRLWRDAGGKAARVYLLLVTVPLVLLGLPAAYSQPPAAPFSDELWNDARPIYEKILQHPFLLGLSDGTLPGQFGDEKV